MRQFVVFLFLVSVVTVASVAHAYDAASDFLNPPDSARPWVYWMFMDGNMSRAGADGRPGIDETRGHRRRDLHGNQHRHTAWAGRLYEPEVAGTVRLRGPRSRSGRPRICRCHRAGLVRHRRALGQAGAIDAAPGGQRDDRTRSDEIFCRVASPATAAAVLRRRHANPGTGQALAGILRRRGRAGLSHAQGQGPRGR